MNRSQPLTENVVQFTIFQNLNFWKQQKQKWGSW